MVAGITPQRRIAAEARTRLAVFLKPTVSDGRHANSGVEAFNAATIAQPPGLLDETAVDPLLDPGAFDINTFNDLDEGFYSWFSIGQMG